MRIYIYTCFILIVFLHTHWKCDIEVVDVYTMTQNTICSIVNYRYMFFVD